MSRSCSRDASATSITSKTSSGWGWAVRYASARGSNNATSGCGSECPPSPDRVLDPHYGTIANEPRQHPGEHIDAARVSRSDGAHLDDQAIEQFHAVVLVEHACPTHLVVLVDREAACRERHGHTIGPPWRHGQVPGIIHDGAEAPSLNLLTPS